MPKLLKNIEGSIIDVTDTSVTYITSVTAEFQHEDYINFNGFIAYLQDLTRAEQVTKLTKPLSFGLKNKYNIPVVGLKLNY
jgi:hypothetical protein